MAITRALPVVCLQQPMVTPKRTALPVVRLGQVRSRSSVAELEVRRARFDFAIKAARDEEGLFTGVASTPTTDRDGDVVEPHGAIFSLPLPLLWMHDARQPIGHVTAARVMDTGIEVSARILRIAEPGTLKDRLDEAWLSVKYGLVRGLSIGFRPIEAEPIKGRAGLRIRKWAWLELSAVVMPANSEANISHIRSAGASPARLSNEVLSILRARWERNRLTRV